MVQVPIAFDGRARFEIVQRRASNLGYKLQQTVERGRTRYSLEFPTGETNYFDTLDLAKNAVDQRALADYTARRTPRFQPAEPERTEFQPLPPEMGRFERAGQIAQGIGQIGQAAAGLPRALVLGAAQQFVDVPQSLIPGPVGQSARERNTQLAQQLQEHPEFGVLGAVPPGVAAASAMPLAQTGLKQATRQLPLPVQDVLASTRPGANLLLKTKGQLAPAGAAPTPEELANLQQAFREVSGVETAQPSVTQTEGTLTAAEKIQRALSGAEEAYKQVERERKAVRGQRAVPVKGLLEKSIAGELSPVEAARQVLAAQKGALPGRAGRLSAEGVTQEDIEAAGRQAQEYFLKKGSYFTGVRTTLALQDYFVNGTVPTIAELNDIKTSLNIDLVPALKKPGFGQLLIDTLNLPRVLKSSWDASFALRQGFWLATGHPASWGRGFVEMFKAISPTRAKLIQAQTEADPLYGVLRDVEVYQAPFDKKDVGFRPSQFEETFISRLAGQIPILGAGVRASERMFVTMGNRLRADVFYNVARRWEREGTVYNPNDPASIKQFRDLADFINVATGRGRLGPFEQYAGHLAAIFYSPRLLVSYAQMPLALKSAPIRGMVAKDLAAAFTTAATLAALTKFGFGAEVELDPRSADFGRVKVGNIHINFFTGYQPLARYAAQLLVGQSKDLKSGHVKEVAQGATAWRFTRSKLAPLPSAVVDWVAGRTFGGDPFTFRSEAVDLFTPLFLKDFADALVVEGWPKALLGGLSGLGVGVTAFIPGKTQETFPRTLPNFPGSIAIENFLRARPKGTVPLQNTKLQ